MDDHKYSRFESTIICPSIRATHYHNALFANSFLTELPITFALGCQSIVDTKCFLVNTDYNHLPINIHPPSLEQTTPMPQVIPLDSTFTHSMHERFATPRKLNLTKLFQNIPSPLSATSAFHRIFQNFPVLNHLTDPVRNSQI